MTTKRLAGTTISAKVTLNMPGDDGPYDLNEAENYLIVAYVEPDRVITKFSREELEGYEQVDESGVDPTAGEVQIVIPGNKTKGLNDQIIFLLPYIQFDDMGEDRIVGAENGQRIELVHIIASPLQTIPTA